MRLHELKQNPDLMDKVRKTLNSATFKQVVMDVLEEEHPGKFNSMSWGLEARAVWQARTSGYQRVLNILKLLLSDNPIKSAQEGYEQLQSTYEDPYVRKPNDESTPDRQG